MRRLVFGATGVSIVLAAGLLSAATPGVTAAERRRALELRKRLTPKHASAGLALAFARIYLRRAYVVDVDPAATIAKALLDEELRLKEKDQLQYFAWALDALIRGAALKDIQTTLKETVKASYSKADTSFFIKSFLANASQYTSPAPLVEMIATVSKNGMVGKRRREFLQWAVAQVKRGENPAYIKQMYDAVSKVAPSFGFQQKYLEKCYNAIRRGVPPRGLAKAVVRMANEYEIDRRLEEGTDRILRLYFAGTPLEKALETVLPRKEKPEEGEEE